MVGIVRIAVHIAAFGLGVQAHVFSACHRLEVERFEAEDRMILEVVDVVDVDARLEGQACVKDDPAP